VISPPAIEDLERRCAPASTMLVLSAPPARQVGHHRLAIERVQRPSLVMAPNKTLAAQLANEAARVLPGQRGEYFVSYYGLLPARGLRPADDTYIEKDSSVTTM